MLSIKALTSLAIVASTALTGAHAQNAGYPGAFDATTGNFVGAVVRITLGGAGIFTLDKTGNTTNYLSVKTFSNTCKEGGPVFIQISGSKDPNVPYVSLVAGVTDCSTAAFSGLPLGLLLRRRTDFLGGYNNLKTSCGECMTFALGNAVGRQVLLSFSFSGDPNSNVYTALPVVQGSTFTRLLVTPDVQAYSNFSGAVVQQLYFSVFFR
ncbi:hypothetical protein B0H14DRAFT_3509359 [Mycena olivaceomarginata]|nr:hypothetical protein B0H14DRAFT_3509359 [Mycena olivaceomarginata]